MPDISEIVDVTITVQSAALTRKGFNSLMVVGAGDDFGSGFDEYEVRQYTTAQQLGEDVDVLDGEAKNMATVAFAQSPSVNVVYLSKVVTEIPGQAYIASTSTGDNSGGMSQQAPLRIGLTATSSPVLSFSPALPAGPSTMTLIDGAGDLWKFDYADLLTPDPYWWQFDGLSNITKNGVSQTDVLLFVEVTVPDVAQLIIQDPAVVSPLSSADLDAVASNNNAWFGYSHVFHTPADNLTASAWVASNKKYGFFRTYDSTGVDVAALNSKYSCGWFTDPSLADTIQGCLDSAVASALLARVPGSYTGAFKTLEVVSPSKVSPTNESALRSNFCNQYTVINQRAITWDGVTSSGGFIDTYVGVLYLEARISEDVFGYMSSVNKVPYTNPGIDGIVAQVQRRLDQSVEEGYLTNDPQPLATAPRVTEISATDKSNRLLPNVVFSATTAGAIHTVQINGTLIA